MGIFECVSRNHLFAAFTITLHKSLEMYIKLSYSITMQKQGDNNVMKPDVISLDQLEQEEKPEKPFTTPQLEDEQSVSGTMADPESDDDTLKNAHDMGLQRGETYDNAEEINTARDIDSNQNSTKPH